MRVTWLGVCVVVLLWGWWGLQAVSTEGVETFQIEEFLLQEDKPQAPPLPQESFVWVLTKTLAFVLCFIFIIYFFALVLRKFTAKPYAQSKGEGVVNVVEVCALSPRSNLYLVDVDGAFFVVAEGASGTISVTKCHRGE